MGIAQQGIDDDDLYFNRSDRNKINTYYHKHRAKKRERAKKFIQPAQTPVAPVTATQPNVEYYSSRVQYIDYEQSRYDCSYYPGLSPYTSWNSNPYWQQPVIVSSYSPWMSGIPYGYYHTYQPYYSTHYWNNYYNPYSNYHYANQGATQQTIAIVKKTTPTKKFSSPIVQKNHTPKGGPSTKKTGSSTSTSTQSPHNATSPSNHVNKAKVRQSFTYDYYQNQRKTSTSQRQSYTPSSNNRSTYPKKGGSSPSSTPKKGGMKKKF